MNYSRRLTVSRQVTALITIRNPHVMIRIPHFDLKLVNKKVYRTFDEIVIHAELAPGVHQTFLGEVQDDEPRPEKLLSVSNSSKRKELV